MSAEQVRAYRSSTAALLAAAEQVLASLNQRAAMQEQAIADALAQHQAAGEQRDLLLRHAGRIEAEIGTLRTHLDYLRAKSALWDARDRGDADAETEANLRVQDMIPRLEEVVLR